MTKTEAIEQLRYLTTLAADLPTAKMRAIRKAEKAQVSKAQIAEALGITRQGLDDFVKRNGDKGRV